ncbi:MAG: FAD-binding protein [Chloroflexi bacterium]|nr:FAD-binding protein [Chloroflexota bacterium]
MAEIEKETDVLVIGGGLAGCWAAIRARAFAPRVTLVDKAVVSRSGASSWAYYLLAPPRDLAVWKKELVEKGKYLNDQDWVDVVLQEHGQRLADMEAWGVPFERDERGNLVTKAGRGHDSTRFVTSDGRTRMEALKRKTRDLGVEIIERVICTDLLTSDGLHPTSGSIVGAIGFQTRTAETIIFKSKVVIVASGPLEPGTNLSGDGAAMAFRAGAELVSMEFCTHSPCFMTDGKRHLGNMDVLFQSLGLRLLNSQGERFMEKYSPALKERSDWTLLSQAIIRETLAGRGPALLDMSQVRDEDIAHFARLHPGKIAPFVQAGLDLKRDRITVSPRVFISSSAGDGGIRIDTHGRTNIPGLFAAGTACKNSVHGTYSVGGMNLAFCCSSGFRAGEAAARACPGANIVPPHGSQIDALRLAFFSQLGRQEGLPAASLAMKAEETICPARVGVVKREDRITNTLTALDALRREVKATRARDIHELIKVRELDNSLLLAYLTFLSALERRETRHSHCREDFPLRDDVDWLKWVVVKNAGEKGIQTRAEPVPIEAYAVKPERRQKILHPVQFDLIPD